MLTAMCVLMVVGGLASGCARKTYDPAWATRAYPYELHRTQTVDMQVFRRGTEIEIVNSSARSYRNFDLWINQRYLRQVESLPAGETIRLSLWEFHDELGDAFYAGGFFRTYEPTPVKLVEIQTAPDQPMVGIVTIRSEPVTVKPEPGR